MELGPPLVREEGKAHFSLKTGIARKKNPHLCGDYLTITTIILHQGGSNGRKSHRKNFPLYGVLITRFMVIYTTRGQRGLFPQKDHIIKFSPEKRKEGYTSVEG